MRLKAIVAAAMAAFAISGVMAGGAVAAGPVVLWPTDQEMAEHPGMGHSATCDLTEEESRQSQFTDEYMIKANEEGRCTEKWEKEVPLTAADFKSAKEHVVKADSRDTAKKANRANAKHGKKYKHGKRAHRSHR